MNSEIIGSWAGRVWNVLHSQGPMTIKEIKNELRLREKDVYAAVGWLAREGKVTFGAIDSDEEGIIRLS